MIHFKVIHMHMETTRQEVILDRALSAYLSSTAPVFGLVAVGSDVLLAQNHLDEVFQLIARKITGVGTINWSVGDSTKARDRPRPNQAGADQCKK